MTENICGFRCNKINGKYIYPRSKLDKKYWEYVNFFKNKNRYYCDINELFKNIYNKAYLNCKKKDHLFYKGIQNFIKKLSEKNKQKKLKKELLKIINKLILYSYNYKYICSKNWNKLEGNGYYCNKNNIFIIKNTEIYIDDYYEDEYCGLTPGTEYNIKIVEYKNKEIIYYDDNKLDKEFNKEIREEEYLIEYYNYTKINNSFIKISNIEEKYRYHMVNNRYIMSSDITIRKQKHICLLCNKDAIKSSYYNSDYTDECNKCNYGMWSCGRDCKRLIGEIKGSLIKCINCENNYFYNITSSGTLQNYKINEELLEIFNKNKISFYAENFNEFNTDYKKNVSSNELLLILTKRREFNKNYYNVHFNLIKNNISDKHKLLNTKLIYKKYKGEYLVDKFLNNPDYIQWLISHGWELDTNKDYNGYGYSQKVIKKQNKIESEFTKIFRYILNIPKYPCDKSNCKKYAMYGIDKNKPFRCTKHKTFSQKIVIQTNCRGVNGVCPYGCKKGNINYDNFCTYCFCHLFPNDKRTKNIRTKSKEIEVINHICLTHAGKWYHDKPLYVNYENICCPSKRRIDLRQLIGNTMLCIEVDENQHKYYTTNDDFIRYNELLCDLTCKYIFIRYNPDKYKKNGKIYNPNIKKRLSKLDKEIKKQINRIKQIKNTDLLEIKHLYYDKE